MGPVDRSGPDVDGRRAEGLHSQFMTPEQPSHDIDQGIDRPHFMERDTGGVLPMHGSFCRGQAFEDCKRLFLDVGRQTARGKEPSDLRPGATFIRNRGNDHVHFRRVDRPAVDFRDLETVSGKRKRLEALPKGSRRKPSVHEGPQRHVPADTGETIKVKMHGDPSRLV